MKKFRLSILMAVFAINAFCQTQLTGIGQLKLYSSISQLPELGNNDNIKLIKTQEDFFKYAYDKTSGEICEIVQDSMTGEGYGGYYNKDIRKFYIPAYKVIPTLEVKCLNLVYYKDSLISIKCSSSSELTEALDLKYGKSDVDVKKEDHTFTYTYTGEKVVKTDETYTQKWQTNAKNVSCKNILMSWYNDKAERLTANNFYLTDTYYVNKISDIEDGIKNRMKEREESAKKQKYDGL
jgi:hypothetical protein